jgi:hypothetical protein
MFWIPSALAVHISDVRVGVYENPPKIYFDDGGELQGIWTDVVNHVAEEEDWNIEYVLGSWPDNLLWLETGEVDMLMDVAYTVERDQIYEYADESLLVSWSTIYASGEGAVDSILDLDGAKIAVLKGSSNYVGQQGIRATLRSFGLDAEFIEMDDYDEVFGALDLDLADAGVVNRFYGQSHEADFDVHPTNIIFFPTELYFAFNKVSEKTPDLMEVMDRYVVELVNDQESIYYQSLQKHFQGFVDEVEVFPLWAKLLIVMFVLILIGALVYFISAKKYAKSLEVGIKERTAKIQQLDSLKSKFITVVAHQLRTPLNAIRWNLESMISGTFGELSGEMKEFMRVTYEANTNVMDRISDMLVSLDIEEKKVELKKEEKSLEEVVSSVLAEYEKRGKIKQVEFVYEKPEKPLPKIQFDVEKIRLCIDHLIRNAFMYTAEKGQIKMSVKEKEGSLWFAISDTGIGIPVDEQPKVYERFFRGSNAMTVETDQSGLGLFIAKFNVEQHGGEIGFTSTEQQGSVFWFSLPVKS